MREILPFGIALYFFHLLLLLDSVPVWLVIVAAVGSLWKTISLRTGLGHAPRILLVLVGMMALSFALLDTPRFWHKQTATIAIVILTLLLILDRPNRRQVMLVHSAFFGLLVAVLVAPGPILPLFIYFGLSSLIMFSLLLHHLPSQALPSLWRLTRNLAGIALPVAGIMLPLYFFFPEIRPNPNDMAVTGLSDSLDPGRIASLALSDKLAFRAHFIVGNPDSKHDSLYWRAAVLEESHGMSWRKKDEGHVEPLAPTKVPSPLVYEMLPEPRLGSTLPLLEHTLYVSPQRKTEVGVFWDADRKLYRTIHSLIEVGAELNAGYRPLRPPPPPQLELQTSPRVHALVETLQGQGAQQQVDTLLKLFHDFRYSLQPGLLESDDPLDDFIFEKKLGYCEHFAAAFASLLQLAGTPARVVTGFEGGERLGSTGFILVLDRHAHAWSEVWMDDKWQRIDPSQFVPGADQRRQTASHFGLLPMAWIAYWTRVATGFLKDLTHDIEMIWIATFSLAGLLLMIQVIRITRRRRSEPPWTTDLNRLLLSLRRRGFVREPSETMGDFLRRLSSALPAETEALEAIRAIYNRVVFGEEQDPAAVQQLKASLHALTQNLRRSP